MICKLNSLYLLKELISEQAGGPYKMEEERQWTEEVLSGNKQAYAKIINKYKNPLYATILRMTGNEQDAVDLVQESFIKIYRQLGKFDGKGSFSSWMYRVAINHWYIL